MDALGIIAIIIALLGIAGCLLPVLPGPPLSWVALLILSFSDSLEREVPLAGIIVWFVITAVITAADYILPGLMAKKAGGHKAAEIGAIAGLFAGMLLTPVGMILGSFLGAFIGEFVFSRQDFRSSLKAAFSAFLAFFLSTGLKLVFSIILLFVIISHLW